MAISLNGLGAPAYLPALRAVAGFRGRSLANFHFHATAACDILRVKGATPAQVALDV